MKKTSNFNPLIVICMATYNPKLDLFADQIKSIVSQTHKNWICIINDDCSENEIYEDMKKLVSNDNRFLVYRNASNLGFYHNFEKCLMKVPKNADLVGFADQDDHWHRDKLSTLLNEFDEDTTLVYSDMNIVNTKGELISNTYWTTRSNNYENLDLLIFANTITGAASLFKRELLDVALPFPERVGDSYHDWWIGCVALANGKLKYIDKPLYEYHQHAGNVLGHFTKKAPSFWKYLLSAKLSRIMWENYAIFLNDFIRIVLVANTLRERCISVSSNKQKIINEFADYQQSINKLMLRYIKSKFRRKTITLGAEGRLLQSYLVTKFYTKYRNAKERKVNLQSIREVMDVEDVSSIIYNVQQKIAPIKCKVLENAKKRINIIIPIIDFTYFFGGYITKFNLAQQLSLAGNDVRLIIADWCEFNPTLWKKEISHYPGLEKFFDKVEISYAFDRSKPIEFSKEDVLVATTWWTAHIANDLLKYLNRKYFVYLIQEYEPFTFPHGTFFALAQQSYEFPHKAIFSTEFLRDFFRQSKIGVFDKDLKSGEENSFSFENAITELNVDKESRNRKTKKVLFYFRPEQHASRNMFEIGVLALSNAIRNGCFDSKKWEFYGIGSVKPVKNIELPNNLELKIIPRTSLEEYKKLLPNYDLGISLMYTPHPNLVSIEMASAGMIVVTNSFANKTQQTLSKVSSNIIVAEPTIDGIEKMLFTAVKLTNDYDSRIEGSKVNWPSKWKDSFNKEIMATILKFFKES